MVSYEAKELLTVKYIYIYVFVCVCVCVRKGIDNVS